MPSALTYPGVYIEEIPSGVRTIVGVGTSIAAFIGRAKRGPINKPVVINSFGDFDNTFGGLWLESTLGYAVRDFYLNGGSQAVIVRLFSPPDTADEAEAAADEVEPVSGRAMLKRDGLELVAVDDGTWGDGLRMRIDGNISKDFLDIGFAKTLNLTEDDLFNLTVRDTKTGQTELFLNLTVTPSPRQIVKVLENESRLVRVKTFADVKPTSHRSADPTSRDDSDIWAGPNKDELSSGVSQVGSDGKYLTRTDFSGPGKAGRKKGLYALYDADLFNLLCIPPHEPNGQIERELINDAIALCAERRAMMVIDPPKSWNSKSTVTEEIKAQTAEIGGAHKNAAVFFPRLIQADPLRNGQLENFVPCGAVAGIFARTDTTRGVWKAPAGFDATLVGVSGLSVPLADLENGELNPLGVNCLRTMPGAGRVVWGARTRVGDDRLSSEWKYIPVRRTALFIEESLYRGTHWVVFEPNDEPLWAQIRLNAGAFMNDLFRQGAFQGRTPREAYFVKCDGETTTQSDINKGIVNIRVGFAPLKPAEFVVIQLQQMAGEIQT